MNAEEIVERIMTQHWDMVACRCWICIEGRKAGLRPREPYLDLYQKFAEVKVCDDDGRFIS